MILQRSQTCKGKFPVFCTGCARYYPSTTSGIFCKVSKDRNSESYACPFFLDPTGYTNAYLNLPFHSKS